MVASLSIEAWDMDASACPLLALLGLLVEMGSQEGGSGDLGCFCPCNAAQWKTAALASAPHLPHHSNRPQDTQFVERLTR